MKARVERLVNVVEKEVNLYATTYGIKTKVGDSTNNNRVLSVRQTIRYLKSNLLTIGLGYNLESVYEILLKKKLFKKLRKKNNRTDAYDLNELKTVINRYVAKDSSLKSVLGRNITAI